MVKIILLKSMMFVALSLFYVGCGNYSEPSNSGNNGGIKRDPNKNSKDKLPPSVMLVSPKTWDATRIWFKFDKSWKKVRVSIKDWEVLNS